MNCILTNIIPRFNNYIGAQKIGGISNLYRILAVPPLLSVISERFEEPIYTGEINPLVRTYRCIECKNEILVGIDQEFSTIEDLKKNGCPSCNQGSFKKIHERKMQ